MEINVKDFNVNFCLKVGCKPRDNKYGVTWCIRCGKLFTKSCGKDLQENEKLIIVC